MFLVPLLYVSNQELIDHHISNASKIVNQQTEQVKQLASHHASIVAKTTQQYASEYTAKAQEMVGVKVSQSMSMVRPKAEPTDSSFDTFKSAAYKPADFPAAPSEDFKTTTAHSVDNTDSTLLDEKEPIAA